MSLPKHYRVDGNIYCSEWGEEFSHMEEFLMEAYKRKEKENEQLKEIVRGFTQNLADKQVPPDPEAVKILNDNLWDLVGE